MTESVAKTVRIELPQPRLTAEDRDRLRSLGSRTVMVRSELRSALRELEKAAEALRSGMHAESDDDELRSLVSAAAKDVGATVDDLAAGVRRFERQLAERPQRLVAAFFGRTMAGKTTLVETLVGGDGSAIGRGGQRTTRATRHCSWGDIALYDTPGIGAFEGEEDAQIARRDVREADLVVFVLTDDSIQEEHFRGLEHIRAENKPVLFLLNAKLAVDQPALRKRFLSEPEAFLGEGALRGHLERLDELARERLGLENYRVLSVQAQAAWLGSTEGDATLLSASRLQHTVEVVTELLTTKAVHLRVRSTYDPSILQLERTAGDLSRLTEEISRQAQVFVARADSLERELARLSRLHCARVQQAISAHLAPRRVALVTWLDENIRASDLSERFEAWLDLETLQRELRSEVEDSFRALEDASATALGQLVDDLEMRITADVRQGEFRFTDWRKALTALRRALQVGGLVFKLARLTKWGKRLGGAAGPVGWVVLIGTEILAQLAKRLPQYNPARRLYVQKAARQLEGSIRHLDDEAAEAARQPIDAVITEGAARHLVDELASAADQLATLADDLNSAAVRIRDHATRLSTSMSEDLLDGQRLSLWCRVPGEVVAVRGALQDDARAALQAATGEHVVDLPGSATDAIRRLAPGWVVSWTKDAVRLSPSSQAVPLDALSRRVVERIARRPMVAVGDDQPIGAEER